MTDQSLSPEEIKVIQEEAKDEATFRTTVMISLKTLTIRFNKHEETSTFFRDDVKEVKNKVMDHEKIIWFLFIVVVGAAVRVIWMGLV